MITISNISAAEQIVYNPREVSSRRKKYIVTFQLNWNTAKYYKPRDVRAIVSRLVRYDGGTFSFRSDADTTMSVAASLPDGQARYAFTIYVANDFTGSIDSSLNAVWAKAGFAVRATVSGKGSTLADNIDKTEVVIDPAGVYARSYAPHFIDSFYELQPNYFMGFDFFTGAHVVPQDATDLYCDDRYEDRTLLNSSGSIANPLYNPYEAMKLASKISAYYGHQVTVHVAPGLYENTEAHFELRANSDVVVEGNSFSTPKLFANEDLNSVLLYSGAMRPRLHLEESLQIPEYTRYPFDVTTKLTVKDIDVSGLQLVGLFDTIDIQRCSVSLSDITAVAIKDFTFLDNDVSATNVEVLHANKFSFIWSSSVARVDHDFVSNKFFMFSRFRLWDAVEAPTKVYSDQVTVASNLGFPFGVTKPMCSVLNQYNLVLESGQHLPSDKIEALSSYNDAVFKNTNLIEDYTTYGTSFEVRRNAFRDASKVSLNAGLGSVAFTNNIVTSNDTSIRCKRAVEVENNTSDYNIKIARDSFGDTVNAVTGMFPWGNRIAPEDVAWDATNPCDYVVGYPTESLRVSGNIELTGTIDIEDPRLRVATSSRDDMCSALFAPYTNRSGWRIPNQYMYLHAVTASYTPAAPTYNAAFSAVQFQDLVRLRPVQGSTYIGSGNPDTYFNNRDGSRQDLGHLGGQNSVAATKAKIFWRDEFASVNYQKLYIGATVTLQGDRSTAPLASTPTYTWVSGEFNPEEHTFTQAANQEVTFNFAGVYEFELTVSDGVGGSDTETIVFQVSESRVFCVDSRKAVLNNVLPFSKVSTDVANWEAIDKSSITWITGGSVVSRKFDGVAEDSVAVNFAMHRDIVLPQSVQRYYMKIKVGKEDVLKKSLVDINFDVCVIDEDDNILFYDKAIINSSNNITTKDFSNSITYGVASCYFSSKTSNNVRVYIITDNLYPRTVTYLESMYIALADEEVDGIYQDARLAIRHHKPGDLIQLADCHIDVPLRVAGRNNFFNIQGGYSEASYVEGSGYTTREWETYKTYLNYLRFAYFTKQRDWAFNAINIFGYAYFDSEVSGVHIVNENEDLPNAYAYSAIEAEIVAHAKVEFNYIKISGMNRAGHFTITSDSLLNIDNKLVINGLKVAECMHGIDIKSEHVDVTVTSSEFDKVPNGCISLNCRTSSQFGRHTRITASTFNDSGVKTDMSASPVARDDQINRRTAGLVSIDGYSIFGGDLVVNYQLAPISIDASTPDWNDLEIDNNAFLGQDSLFNICFQQPMVPGSRIKIHHNSSSSGKDFIGVVATGKRGRTGPYYFPPIDEIPENAAAIDMATATIADVENSQSSFFACYENDIVGMRSLVHITNGGGFFEDAGSSQLVYVKDNATADVAVSLYFGPTSTMTPQIWDKLKQHYGIDGLVHWSWNYLAAYPEVEAEAITKLLYYGMVPSQILPTMEN